MNWLYTWTTLGPNVQLCIVYATNIVKLTKIWPREGMYNIFI